MLSEEELDGFWEELECAFVRGDVEHMKVINEQLMENLDKLRERNGNVD
jgi:hypothetical protein